MGSRAPSVTRVRLSIGFSGSASNILESWCFTHFFFFTYFKFLESFFRASFKFLRFPYFFRITNSEVSYLTSCKIQRNLEFLAFFPSNLWDYVNCKRVFVEFLSFEFLKILRFFERKFKYLSFSLKNNIAQILKLPSPCPNLIFSSSFAKKLTFKRPRPSSRRPRDPPSPLKSLKSNSGRWEKN